MLACSLCDKRCCKELLITITSFDAVRISEYVGKAVEEFAELIEPRILNVDWSTVLECREGYRLLALKSRPCIFFKDGKCSIFEAAPLACRLYPHTLEGFNWQSACPLTSKVIFHIHNPGLKVREQYKREISAYRKLVAKLNEKKLRERQCLRELMKMTRREPQQFHP